MKNALHRFDRDVAVGQGFMIVRRRVLMIVLRDSPHVPVELLRNPECSVDTTLFHTVSLDINKSLRVLSTVAISGFSLPIDCVTFLTALRLGSGKP